MKLSAMSEEWKLNTLLNVAKWSLNLPVFREWDFQSRCYLYGNYAVDLTKNEWFPRSSTPSLNVPHF